MEFGLKKFHAWKNHGIKKKEHFHGKIMEFVSVIRIFLNIRINFVEFILCHLCFFLSLIFDYLWLHVCTQIFDVKTIYANNNNLGKLPLITHMQPKRN